MKTMFHAAMVAAAILAEPGLAAAQANRPDPSQALGSETTANGSATRGIRDQLRGAANDIGTSPAAAPVRKSVRPEKTFGPDLAVYVATPVGALVTPINAGLRAFDAAMAPLNDALRPITGPLAPVPVPSGPAK